MIFGERIKQARELRAMTQAELAERLTITQSFIAQLERGSRKPPDELMAGLVFQLGFPPSFFEQPPTDDFPLGSLLFRAHASMTEREQREVYRWAQTTYDLYNRMLSVRRVREVPLHVPRCSDGPSVAAAIARSELGLSPDEPVPNMINTLEKAGVLAIALPGNFEGRDAFSLWATAPSGQRRPVVAIVANQPADRLRMSVAHELGHIVMHQPLTMGVGNVEEQAKEFAGCFLLPEAGMRHDMAEPVTLETFVNLKLRWGVSIQALIVRANELGLINTRKYHYLFAKLTARGWRKREPRSLDVPLERPRALRQVAELIYGIPINYRKLAADANMNESFVREIVELHAGKSRSVAVIQKQPKPPVPSSPREVIAFPGRRKV